MLSIITLLQIALSLLGNPQVQANPALLAQANTFAIQAIQMAETSLTTANTTSTATSTATTTPYVVPIVIPNVPVVTSTAPSAPLLGASNPTPQDIIPPKTHVWDMVTQWDRVILASTTELRFYCAHEGCDSGSITFGSTTYPLVPIDNGKTMELDIIFDNATMGFVHGKVYPYTYQINSGSNSATDTSFIAIPLVFQSP